MTTVLFSDRYKILHNHRDIKDVEKMTEKDYTPGGMTALLDAVGKTIRRIDLIGHTRNKAIGNKVLLLSLLTVRKITVKNILMIR